MTHHIVSGEEPREGLKVLTNEYRWGVLTALDTSTRFDGTLKPCGHYCEAWHTITYPDGRRVNMNCDRLTTIEPRRL
jgi:hypothetical protein